MNTYEIINELNFRKKEYLSKSKRFNSNETVLICLLEERDELIELGKNYNFIFDQIYLTDKSSINIDEIISKYGIDMNYFVSASVINDSLYSNLCRCIDQEKIYVGPTKKTYIDLYDKREIVYNNADSIAKLYDMLADKKSKNLLMNILTRLCLPYQYHFYYEIEDFMQYFSKDFKFEEDEVYVDAGVCDGINIKQFIDVVGGKYNYIYGIEADYNNYCLGKKNLKDVKRNISLYNKALYDQNTIVKFLSTSMSTKRGNARIQEDGDVMVETMIGDDLELIPTFIKMDIEGAEMRALEGFTKTIRSKGPKLAICTYHGHTSFWEVPLMIKKLNPKYNIAIRNHEKMRCLTETVCYAWMDESYE